MSTNINELLNSPDLKALIDSSVAKAEQSNRNIIQQQYNQIQELTAVIQQLKLQINTVNSKADDNNRREVLQPVTPPTAAVVKPNKPNNFDGTNLAVSKWIFQMNTYFNCLKLNQEITMVENAVTFLRGAAEDWWRILCRKHEINKTDNPCSKSWSTFCREITTRFEIVNAQEVARDKLAELKQTTSVQQYIAEFLAITNEIVNISDDERMDRFERGLKPKLRQQLANLKVIQPNLTLEMMMSQAERLDRQQFKAYRDNPYRQKNHGYVSTRRTEESDSTKLEDNQETATDMEIDAYRFGSPGFCPRCGKSRHWAKDCPNIKTVTKSKSTEVSNHNSKTTADYPERPNSTNSTTKLYRMSDITATDVLTLQGRLNNHPVTILIDSGATNDFVSQKFIKRTLLSTQALSKPAKVIFGDGSSTSIKHQLTTANLKIQQYQSNRTLVVAPINKYDIILGQTWLKQENPNIDWQKKTITIKKQRMKPITLTANKEYSYLNEIMLSTTQLKKSLKHDDKIFLCFIQPTTKNQELNEIELDKEDKEDDKASRIKEEYKEIFGELPPGLPPDRFGIEHHIRIQPNSTIPSRSPYRLSPDEQNELKKQLQELIDKDFIRPSASPYASPVLFVKKKNGKLRMCIDYRAVNKITIRNNYPLPKIDELLDRLYGAKVFSKFDLSSGYYQVKVADEDIEKTAFATKYGLYEYKVLPFGLTGAPATFMTLMNRIFYEYLDKFLIVYLDDILIYSRNEEEHQQHLRLVLDKLKEHRLIVNDEKSELFKEKVTFLGFDVDGEGIHTEEAKIKTIKDWPIPNNKQQVRSFLGLTNYYRRFVRNYATIAKPLTDIQGENKTFEWNQEQQQSFQDLKKALTSAPVLSSPQPDKDYYMFTDASDFAVGGVLCQKDENDNMKPIAYESHKLSPAEQNYAVHEKETLAIIYCLTKWRHYLESRKTIISTDHHSLQYLHTQPKLSRRQARWMELLANFDIEIKYIPGRLNSVADALSRRADLEVEVTNGVQINMLSSSITSEVISKTKQALTVDPYYNKKKDKLPSHLVMKEELLFKKQGQQKLLLYVPQELRKGILYEAHENGGHGGIRKTTELVKRTYWWPGWYRDVNAYVKSCVSCQHNKARNHSPYGLLMPLPIAQDKWRSISMDFITELPKSHDNYDSIMVVVDRFTKMAKFIPMTNTNDAPAVAKLFFTNIFRNFGLPQDIVSDRDSKFQSRFWQALMNLCGTKLKFSTSYHPQTDGQTERTNRTLEEMLRSYCNDNQDDWINKLPFVEFNYNNTINQSTGYSPFYLCYGYNPTVPMFLLQPYQQRSEVQSVDEWIELMKKTNESAKSNIQQAIQKQSQQANKHRKDMIFEEGDMVLLSTTNLKLRGSRKLNPRFVGPFKIIKKISDVAYKLQLTHPFDKIHDVFHVSLLKPFVIDPYKRGYERPPPELVDGAEEYEVERIVDKRVKTIGKRTKIEYLVKWKDYPAYENTWEPIENLTNCKELLREFNQRQHK